MSIYGYDDSLYEYGFSDPSFFTSIPRNPLVSFPIIYDDDDGYDRRSRPQTTVATDGGTKISPPPIHRHDGTSPLPLGMDWSLPPRVWDGRNSVWPHDPHSGWSYCVTIPSWSIQPYSKDSDSVVFFRVQVSIQSPKGITTTRGVLRRFSDFLKLFSELRKAFPRKNLPPAPSKRFLKLKKQSKTLLEERRCALEDWMEKLLSDIDLSRTAAVAIFLELEAAARSSFYDSYEDVLEADSVKGMGPPYTPNPGASFLAGNSSIASDTGNDSAYETSELGTPKHGMDGYNDKFFESASDQKVGGSSEEIIGDSLVGNIGPVTENFIQQNQVGFSRQKLRLESDRSDKLTYPDNEVDISSGLENRDMTSHVRRLSNESIGSDISSIRASESSNLGLKNSLGRNHSGLLEGAEASRITDVSVESGLQFSDDLLVGIPLDERQKMNRVLTTMKQRLGTAKMDMEDLISRLDQDIVVKQYLSTKVKELELELETTKHSGNDNLQQAVLSERDRFTQMQWDLDELRKKCMETELKLKSEQEARVHLESIKDSINQENEILLQELDDARKQIEILKKHHYELDMKSKSDVKLLVKEVKSLRNSNLELKQELSTCKKENLDLEGVLQKEKQRWECTSAAKAKLLHECEVLRHRLRECSVNFLIEEEDKLMMDTSLPSDAIDLLVTSDNRIGLLLAEAQLLAHDVGHAIAVANQDVEYDATSRTDDELRMMLTGILMDNAKLRKQVNFAIRCALTSPNNPENGDVENGTPPAKTVLSKFLER